MDARTRDTLRLSLVGVWLGTALVSLIELHGASTTLLHEAGLRDPLWIRGLILGGIAVDGLLGLLLWWYPGRKVYLGALGMMLLMTALATALQPALWLHPLGPLLKNLPIAAMLWAFAKDSA